MSDETGDRRPQSRSWLGRVAKALNIEPASVADLRDILSDAVDRGVLDHQVLPLLEGAMLVSDMQVREIMVPLSQTISIPIGADMDDMLRKVIDSGHSRFPVTDEDEGDIKGILHAKDLLPLTLPSRSRTLDLNDYIRSARTIPESMRLDDLLQEFRTTRNHMAIVIDEYGTQAGVVTIEDVLEQIVGNIEDEYDVDDDSFIKQIDLNNFVIKATTPISEFNQTFQTGFSSTEYDTISGIILREFGHMPKRGDSIQLGEFRVVVLNADSRRLNLLQISRGATQNPLPTTEN